MDMLARRVPMCCQLSPCTILVVIVLAGVAANATVRHVPEEYPTIQAAIDASVTGDTVLLSPGVYRGPGNRDIELRGLDLVITSSAGADQTVIDCEREGRGFYIHELETPAARIEGLTISNGLPVFEPWNGGGGILSGASAPTIVNCRIVSCEAGVGAGLALMVFDGVVDRCLLSGNNATASYNGGGGVEFLGGSGEIRDCVIAGNSAPKGGGIYFNASGRITGCTIAGNLATEDGGGIWTVAWPLELERCILWGNCAWDDGDEVFCRTENILCECCAVDSTGVVTLMGPDPEYDEDCVFVDPLFCDPAPCGLTTDGDWRLDTNSLCLPENSPCAELIGALGQGCGDTPAIETTWGAIKALYRE